MLFPYLLISINELLISIISFNDINKYGLNVKTAAHRALLHGHSYLLISIKRALLHGHPYLLISIKRALLHGHSFLLISIKRAPPCSTWTLPKQFIMITPYYYLLMTVLYLFSHPN